MKELYITIVPFLKYFVKAIEKYPAITITANSESLDAFDQHICKCLDDVRHVMQLFKEYIILKSSVPQLYEIESELQKQMPCLFE